MDIALTLKGRMKSRKRKFTPSEKTITNENKNRVVQVFTQKNKDRKYEDRLPLNETFTLDCFSDEVLFEIFRHVDAITLLSLEGTCKRFYVLIQDYRFWNIIDLSDKGLRLEVIETCLKKSHISTKTIKIRGVHENHQDIEAVTKFSQILLKSFSMKCSNLNVLELKRVTIDFRQIQILDFPNTLKRLVLDDCNICKTEDIKSIFSGIDTHLIFLEELCIENNEWFDPFFVMAFSKIPKLKLLSLKGCPGLMEFVPYGSMAARFGFKKLEHLDVRDTPIKDSDLQCFNAVVTLKVLLLECPSRSTHKTTFPNRFQRNDLSYSETPSISSPSSSSISLSSVESFPRNNRFVISRQQPDQIIYLDLHNRRRVIVMNQNNFQQRPQLLGQANASHQLDDVLLQPILWNFLNPLERPSVINSHNHDNDAQNHRSSRPSRSTSSSPITDRGICCFGRPQRPVEQGIIWVRIGNRPDENRFERLSVRHYTSVSDISLQHLVQCSPHLVYLDLTGTSVTREGVKIFKSCKPNCQLIANHLID